MCVLTENPAPSSVQQLKDAVAQNRYNLMEAAKMQAYVLQLENQTDKSNFDYNSFNIYRQAYATYLTNSAAWKQSFNCGSETSCIDMLTAKMTDLAKFTSRYSSVENAS